MPMHAQDDFPTPRTLIEIMQPQSGSIVSSYLGVIRLKVVAG